MTIPPQYMATRFNQVVEVSFRAGWIGLFAGENQTKALNRTLDQLNTQGLGVAGMVVDRWSFWRRLVWAFVLVITLGFVGRVPNVLIATEPIGPRGFTPPSPPTPSVAVPPAAPVPPTVQPAPARPEIPAAVTTKEISPPRKTAARPAKKTAAKKATPAKQAQPRKPTS